MAENSELPPHEVIRLGMLDEAKPYFIQSAVNKGMTPQEAEYVFNYTKWHSSRTKTVFPPDYAGDPTLEVTYRAIAYGLTEGDLYAIDLQRQAQSIQIALDYNVVQLAAISVSRYNNTGTGTGASTGAGSPAKPPAGVKGAANPSALAKGWQGSGDYPGIDNWGDIVLKKGTKVWGGAPGQSNFYTTDAVMESVGTDATKLYNGLQVGKGAYPTFRPGMTMYELTEDINVGYSKALANPQYGTGGFDQYFINGYQDALKPILSRVMTNK